MKVIIIILTLAVMGSVWAEGGKWSQVATDAYTKACVGGVKDLKIDGQGYCGCMLTKIEGKYASPSEAMKMSKEERTAWATDCLKSVGDKKKGWSELESKAFTDSCVKGTKDNKSVDGKGYCSCMLTKIEDKYPTAAAAVKMSDEERMSWAKDCVKRHTRKTD